VFTETLRKYQVLPFLDRVCSSDYKLPAPTGNGTITLPAGTCVYIPILSIHHDPMYLRKPDKFDREHFTEENKRSRPNFTYIPFGDGPRMCIGKDRHLSVPCMSLVFGVTENSYYPFYASKPFSLVQRHAHLKKMKDVRVFLKQAGLCLENCIQVVLWSFKTEHTTDNITSFVNFSNICSSLYPWSA
jgi:hypothetical protein